MSMPSMRPSFDFNLQRCSSLTSPQKSERHVERDNRDEEHAACTQHTSKRGKKGEGCLLREASVPEAAINIIAAAKVLQENCPYTPPRFSTKADRLVTQCQYLSDFRSRMSF
jgi:hypothetical protein